MAALAAARVRMAESRRGQSRMLCKGQASRTKDESRAAAPS